jgi:hypothetical protein
MRIILGVFIIAVWLVGSVDQVTAETWQWKFFNHVAKVEGLPITDTETLLNFISSDPVFSNTSKRREPTEVHTFPEVF